jgi:hypothetical protein
VRNLALLPATSTLPSPFSVMMLWCSKYLIKWWSTCFRGPFLTFSFLSSPPFSLLLSPLFSLFLSTLLLLRVLLVLLLLPLVLLLLLLILLYFLHLLEQGTKCHEHQWVHPDAPWMMSNHPMERKN